MLLQINISKRVSIISLVIILLLVACGTVPTVNTSPTINLTDVNSTAQSAAVILFAQTMAPTLTATAAPTNTPNPTPTPLSFKALEGLRVAYVSSQGNLFVQDSGKQAVELTSDVVNSSPVFSDDGQKIAFLRGTSELWVIGVDGTGERVIITLGLLRRLSEKYDEFTALSSLAFIPLTHSLLFNTGYNQKSNPHLNKDLLFVNADTGEIRQLRAPDQGGNFLASPDGKKIAIQTVDHVDVIDIQGKLLLSNLVARSPIDETYGISWAEMFWTPDSNELIVLPSKTDPAAAGITPLSTVWRYSLDSGSGIEIKLTPPPILNAYAVSPDGNWLAYTYDPGAFVDPTDVDPNETRGVYLGNLHDGTSQLLYTPPLNKATGFHEISPQGYDGWSPDSLHFIVDDMWTRLFMGNIRGEFVPIGVGRGIGVSAWTDNNHFLTDDGVLHDVGNQELVQVVDSYFDAFVFLGH